MNPAPSEVQPDRTRGIRVFRDQNFLADFGPDVQFLGEARAQTRFVGLAGLALAAGKLPVAGQMRAFEPARHEESAVPFDHGRRARRWWTPGSALMFWGSNG